jgi:hypothetical protein
MAEHLGLWLARMTLRLTGNRELACQPILRLLADFKAIQPRRLIYPEGPLLPFQESLASPLSPRDDDQLSVNSRFPLPADSLMIWLSC